MPNKLYSTVAAQLCVQLAGQDSIEPGEAIAVVDGWVVHVAVQRQAMIETPLASEAERETAAAKIPDPPAPAHLPESAPVLFKLTGLQEHVLEAAPSRLHHPISLKELAKLSGYCYNRYFRERVNELVDAGLLVRLSGGVRKPS